MTKIINFYKNGELSYSKAAFRVLYEDTNANTKTGSITLATSVNEFRSLLVNFKAGTGEYGSVEIYDPNGKTVCLITQHSGGTASGFFYTMDFVPITIKKNKITFGSGRETGISQRSTITACAEYNNIGITHVVGKY